MRSDHAAVTAAAHDGPMLSARRHGAQGQAGVLILRVWLEGSANDPQMRIRMLGRPDLNLDTQDTMAAATIGEALAYVHDWLERFTRRG
jgi:hypothetical protein